MAQAMHPSPKKPGGLFSPGAFIQPRAFIQGLAAGLFLLAALVVWMWLRWPVTERTMAARMASVTVPLDKGDLDKGGAAQAGISLEAMKPDEAKADEAESDGNGHAAAATAQAGQPPAPDAAHADISKTTPPVRLESATQDAAAALPSVSPDGLTEDTSYGKLPVINKQNGMTAFRAYRRPFDMAKAAGKPVVSLIVTDAGLSQAATDAAMKTLPPQVSIALSPYAGTPDAQVAAARARGHEVWLVLPMQSPSYPRVDPGPHTLLTGVPVADNLKKIMTLMARAGGYAGFIGSRDANFTASEADLTPMLNEIYERGLGFIDPSGHAPGDPVHPNAKADVWFARDASKSDIDAALTQLEDTARKNGRAIGVVPPLPLIFPAVQDWIKGLPQKGIVLAPVSALADKGASQPPAPAPAPVQNAAATADAPHEPPAPSHEPKSAH